MVGIILWAIYLIGIPANFLLLGGLDDFKSDPDITDPHEAIEDRHDRMLSFTINIGVSVCWPMTWITCLAVAVLARFFRLS